MSLTVVALKTEIKDEKFDLFETLTDSLEKNRFQLCEGDIIVISSKFISNSQGRLLNLKNINTTKEGKSLSKKFQMNPELAEIILRESDFVFGGIVGFVITSLDNILASNAGIDKSNAKIGKIILYPLDPFLISEQLKRKFFLNFQLNVGIIITDSRLMPTRIGTSGIALACSGIEPVLDKRAEKDLMGNSLKVTHQAIVDNLATIANHKMGEGSESTPIAIIRDSQAQLTSRKIHPHEMTIPPDQCLFIRGFKILNNN